MFKSFLRIAIRFLWRNKTYSLLNFSCLTFGLTFAIISALYTLNVFSYDKFHKNYDRLYEVEAYVTYFNGDRFPKEPMSASLIDVLNKNVPEIESVTRVVDRSYKVINGDYVFTENGIYADENFFNMFSFPLISAESSNVLSDINSIVITERIAIKLFNTKDCLGKMMILEDDTNQKVFKITGVLSNVPSQSLLQFDFIIPFKKFLADNNWANETGASANQVWILLKNNANLSTVTSKIKDLIKYQETTLNQELFLFPLKEKVLYSYANGKRVWHEMQNVVIFGSIAFAILLIACFNFINLAIALNIKRYREAGIKKVAGATRSSIILHFLGETFILTIISLLCALVLVNLLLGSFNMIFNSDIKFSLSDFKTISVFAVITFFTGLFSGLFPALYLSSSNPVDVLKGKIVTNHSFSVFRQSLIVFQFTIPIVLIICMMIIKTQEIYIRNYDIGFDKNKLIVINNSKNLEDHEESLKADLLSIPDIEAVSFTNCIPTRGTRVSNDISWEGKDVSEKPHFWCVNTDYNYDKAVQINIINGRFFDKSFLADSVCYLVNDIAANVMKNKDPVGSTLILDGKKGTIIGVFKDFHAIDLAGPVTPTIISLTSKNRNTLLIRISSAYNSALKENIGKVYNRYEPEILFQPFLFRDLPEYSGLENKSNLVGLAFFMALILACLGLYGIASFTAERRTKEIGIRKANGATSFSIIILLLKDYTRWLTIAYFIALPVAYYIGNIFLARFYFRCPMPFWTFAAGPAIAYIVALLTVTCQSFKAATRNPIKSLKYE